jgi:hypothetical protein
MPIDWSFNRREYSLPSFDLGDVLLQRAQYQRNLGAADLEKQQLEAAKTQQVEHARRSDAFQRLLSPGVQSQPVPAVAAPPAPQAPDLGPLVKAPQSATPPGYTVPPTVQASPGRQQAAQQAIQQDQQRENDENQRYIADVQRLQGQFIGPQMSPDQMSVMGLEGYTKYLEGQPALVQKANAEASRLAARNRAQESRERAATARTAEERRYHDLRAKQWDRQANFREGQPDFYDKQDYMAAMGTDPASIAQLRIDAAAQGADARARREAAREAGIDRRFRAGEARRTAGERRALLAPFIKAHPELGPQLDAIDRSGQDYEIDPGGMFSSPTVKGKPRAPEAGSTGIAPNVPDAGQLMYGQRFTKDNSAGGESTTIIKGSGPLPSKVPIPDDGARPAPAPSPAANFKASDATRTRDNVGKPAPRTDESGSSLTGPTKGSNLPAGSEEAADPFAKLRKKKKVSVNAS